MRKRKPRTQKNKSKAPLFIIVALVLWFLLDTNPPTNYSLIIANNQNLASIAKELKSAEIISSEKFFLFQASRNNLDTSIHTGEFRLNSDMDNLEILKLLNQPSQNNQSLTIPEGFTIKQIAHKSQEKEILKCLISTCQTDLNQLVPETSSKGLEGFLFPNTYQYTGSQDLINKMTQQFQEQLPKNYQEQLQKLPIQSLYDAIIVASMLEKEVITQTDKQLAAGIIYKRLQHDWPLGIDATLLYKKNNREITMQDLQANDPYNTRKLKGLPPTPICNPGYESIFAALNPIQSDYWFYITEPINDKVIYGRNNAEHEANIQKHLR